MSAIVIWLATLTVATCLPILIYWQYWRWTHRRMIQLAKMVPGPPQFPFFGNALMFMANPKEQLNIISNLSRQYGQYLRFWVGPDLNICVRNPEDIRLLLTSNKLNEKGPVYSHMEPYIGQGLLSGGPAWRDHRKTVMPCYNKKAVHHYSKVFNREAMDLVEVLKKKEPNDAFNVYDNVLYCTTQCVCQTLMGLSKEDALNVKNLEKVMVTTPRIYSFIFKKMTRWWLQIPLVYWLVGGKKREKYYLNIINVMTTDIIYKKRSAFEKDPGVDKEKKGIIDRYFSGSGELSHQELVWQTFSVFTTSQEASAKIAAAMLLFLSQLPDWQEKVYNEIVEVLGPDDVDVTDDQVNQLQFLDMVFRETIRYLPIAALIQRTVKEEISINKGNFTIPPGTSVVIMIHDLHRDPQYWEEPNKVMPERFLPENVKKRDPNVFIPFSLGPMDCLGRVYAKALTKTIVVRVLRHMHLEPAGPRLEDLELHIAISVKFAQGYNLRVRSRKPS